MCEIWSERVLRSCNRGVITGKAYPGNNFHQGESKITKNRKRGLIHVVVAGKAYSGNNFVMVGVRLRSEKS